MAQRCGVTLMELLVTLVVLGVVFSVVALSLTGEHGTIPSRSVAATVRGLRARAVASGAPQTMVLADSTSSVLVTAYPDGRVFGAVPALDRLSGITNVVGTGHGK